MIKFIAFLTLNFLALGLGGYLSAEGLASTWYKSLKQAPWLPAGWVFGFAWTSIMLAFSFYMSLLWSKLKDQAKGLILSLFVLQWFLNVGWNAVFFKWQQIAWGLLVMKALILVLILILVFARKALNPKDRKLNYLLAPYLIWLGLAHSLNFYLWLYN